MLTDAWVSRTQIHQRRMQVERTVKVFLFEKKETRPIYIIKQANRSAHEATHVRAFHLAESAAFSVEEADVGSLSVSVRVRQSAYVSCEYAESRLAGQRANTNPHTPIKRERTNYTANNWVGGQRQLGRWVAVCICLAKMQKNKHGISRLLRFNRLGVRDRSASSGTRHRCIWGKIRVNVIFFGSRMDGPI